MIWIVHLSCPLSCSTKCTDLAWAMMWILDSTSKTELSPVLLYRMYWPGMGNGGNGTPKTVLSPVLLYYSKCTDLTWAVMWMVNLSCIAVLNVLTCHNLDIMDSSSELSPVLQYQMYWPGMSWAVPRSAVLKVLTWHKVIMWMVQLSCSLDSCTNYTHLAWARMRIADGRSNCTLSTTILYRSLKNIVFQY